jgi:hypothetical protein
MIWRCLVFMFSFCVYYPCCFSQEALGEAEIDAYLNSSKLACDSYMLTVKTEFSSEPGRPDSYSGTEEFVELVSKADGIRWVRARRDARPSEVDPNGEYPCIALPRQWCRVEVEDRLYGLNEQGVSKDPFHFVQVKTVNSKCLVFPRLFDWPFLNPGTRSLPYRESAASIFQSKYRCISGSEKHGDVVSKWSSMNGSMMMWEVESNDGYPSIVKWVGFSKPVMDAVPDSKPVGFVTFNRIEWQEDEFGKYPKRILSSQTEGLPLDQGLAVVVEAEFKLNVDDNKYEQELARVKKRLQELKSNKGTE